MNLWPHQAKALEDTRRLLDAGTKGILITSPTGGGKSKIAEEIMKWGKRVHFYTNRIMLREQLAEGLREAGINFGQIAAGERGGTMQERVQLCSIQTVHSRFTKRDKQLPEADICMIDEAHQNTAEMAEEIAMRYPHRIGLTATPLNVGPPLYDELVVAGTNSELRDCGALVPADIFAPDEPDCRNLKASTKTGEYTEGSVRKAIMTPTIFGRVIEHWRMLNPDQKPTLLFAPGVKESQWFAEQFQKQGVNAAHIDGEKIWCTGVECPSSQEARSQLKEMSENGSVKVVCNRFVLREGISWNHLAHGIFATCYGSLTAYIQSGGRLLRNHPSLERVRIQDHGGNAIRHGSLNINREWELGADDRRTVEARKERLREKEEQEPIVCPKCSGVRAGGPKCPHCGFEHTSKSRWVMQKDGTLKRMSGDVYKKRPKSRDPADVKTWKGCVFGSKQAGQTFRQARAKFIYKTGHEPDPSLGLVPVDPDHWYEKVGKVDWKELSKQSVFVEE